MLAGPLIKAWVGPRFEASIPIVQILVTVIAIRVGSATGTTLLKGAGHHRLLAFTNASTALANLALSLWIRRSDWSARRSARCSRSRVASVLVLWPAACRRVGVGVAHAFLPRCGRRSGRSSVMAATVIPLRTACLPRDLAEHRRRCCAAGGLMYAVTFFAFAMPRQERSLYTVKIRELLRRRWRHRGGSMSGRTRLKGIILAAGKGARLNGTAGDGPKCLLRVGGSTLVERQIETLRAPGVEDVTVVVGCQADLVRRICGRGISSSRTPVSPRPTASTRSGWHDLC